MGGSGEEGGEKNVVHEVDEPTELYYNLLSAAMDRVDGFAFLVGCTDIGATRISFLLLFRECDVLELNGSLLSSSSSSSSPTSFNMQWMD